MTGTNDRTRSHGAEAGASRRDFIKHASLVAGLAAGMGLAAKSARASSTPMMVNAPGMAPTPPKGSDPIKIAVIGPGGMGTGHCRAFVDIAKRNEQSVEVVAVADVNDLHAERAVKAIREQGQQASCESYRDYRQLLERKDIHGVVVASPEHWHAKHAIDALMSGKDVYCEKPMTLRLEEALLLREVVRQNPDKMFVVGTQKMGLPKYIEAKKIVEAGGIGQPIFSQTSYCRNTPAGEWNYYGLDPAWEPGKNLDWKAWLGTHRMREWDPKVYIRWRRYREFSTGIVGDLLVHEMTPMMMVLENQGWPTRVVASGAKLIDKEMDNHDVVNLNIQFESGHTMLVAGTTNNEVGFEQLIRGQKANLYLNSRHCVIRPERPFVDDIDEKQIDCPDIGNDQDELRRKWLKSIRDRKQPESTVELGTRVMVAVDLATRSMWDGCAYEFDPNSMTTRRI